MIDAVLFDWTNTLVEWTWDDELLADGHRKALAAVASNADPADFTERYRELVLPRAGVPYAELLRELGIDDPDRFIDAEHEVWQPAHAVLGSAQALLDSLRSRGVKTGLVANAWPEPSRVLRADVDASGLAPFLDVLVFSDEVGARKPDPKPFLAALDALRVDPTAAMYVGDSLDTDVQGAAHVGMTTVQALWFRADDTPATTEPDFLAFTPMDVLNAVLRLAR
jgi:HAD superfamily hydrolase (TIGR01509 family)